MYDMPSAPAVWEPPLAPDAALPALEASLASTLRDAARRYDHVALACSLQAEDLVLLDAATRQSLPFEIFMLDTGRLHAETIAYVSTIERHFGISITRMQPDAGAVALFEARHGAFSFYESRDERTACCGLRKVVPLGLVLAGCDAWVTGQRRMQSETRTALAVQERDHVHAIDKLNPLADWSEEAVWEYLRAHDVPVHPLYARGYASIGCEPCTRAIRKGEPVRAGRWWWEDAASKECGLHVAHAGAVL